MFVADRAIRIAERFGRADDATIEETRLHGAGRHRSIQHGGFARASAIRGCLMSPANIREPSLQIGHEPLDVGHGGDRAEGGGTSASM